MAAIVQTPLSSRSRYLWVDRERGRFLVHRSAYTSPEIFEEERQLTQQRRKYLLLHGWLLVHVPLSITLLVLGGIHALVAIHY